MFVVYLKKILFMVYLLFIVIVVLWSGCFEDELMILLLKEWNLVFFGLMF